jgi:hypothetical protein
MKISTKDFNLEMSSVILSKEEQQKLNNQIKEKFGDKNTFSVDNYKKNNTYREEPTFVYSNDNDEDYLEERDYKSIQLDFKTLKDLFIKEQQLSKLEEKSRYQTLDISNLTLKVTELEEKISELEEENSNNKHSIELIESIVKFNNRDVNGFKIRNSNSIYDIQNNITEIELSFRKVEKEYNEIIKNMNNIDSEEVKRYLNSMITVKYHNIVDIYNKRYNTINNINLQRNAVNILSVIVMFISLIYTLIYIR